MAGKADIEALYRAVREAAALVDTDCSPASMQPVLTAFQDLIVSPVVFNTVAGGGLSLDFTTPAAAGDPYERALAHGLAEDSGHPIRHLFTQLHEHLPVHAFGVDHKVGTGFNKTYAFFPMGRPQDVARLTALTAMPPALAEQAATFAAHGLDGKISALAIDYTRRTWNVYFNGLGGEHVERGALRALLGDFGLPDPSEQLLDFAERSSALYPTFGWDSTKIERVSFSLRTTDPAALPAQVEPRLEKLARNAPYTYPGQRVLVYAGVLAPGREYYKLAAYHQMDLAAHDRVRPRT